MQGQVDWWHLSDCVLQEVFDYHNSDIEGLKNLLSLIGEQCGNNGFWPAEASHELFHAMEKNLEPDLIMRLRPPGSP